ncbi:hypothetical protein [Corynebacterium frankenforstense]
MTSAVLLLACISFVLFVAVVATNNTVLVVLMFIALAAAVALWLVDFLRMRRSCR